MRRAARFFLLLMLLTVAEVFIECRWRCPILFVGRWRFDFLHLAIHGMYDPRQEPITATKQAASITVNGVPKTIAYFRQTMVLKARHEGWEHVVQDVGVNERVSIPGTSPTQYTVKPILDGVNVPVKKPWPLDGAGKRKPNANDSPAELRFKPYLKKDWSSLTFA